MHYLIIIGIISVVIIIQLIIMFDTNKKIINYRNILPEKFDCFLIENYEIQTYEANKRSIKLKEKQEILDYLNLKLEYINTDLPENEIEKIDLYKEITSVKSEIDILNSEEDFEPTNASFKLILNNINNYLKKNSNSMADYHLMKDIVDRNCETKDDEIATQVPFTLYLGLVGTMIGIIVGTVFLLIGLNGNSINIENVKPLLVGVAIAMVASVIGIISTTFFSNSLKKAQLIVGVRKNAFLSWIQAELLPVVNTDISGTLSKMTSNLNNFNVVFSENTKLLHTTLSGVNVSYQDQAKLLETIERMKITKIATANIEVYDKLKNCTDVIGRLGDYLNGVENYISRFDAINEEQGQSIVKMAALFNEWENEVNLRKSAINQVIGGIDNSIQQVLTAFKDSTQKQYQELVQTIVVQQDVLNKFVLEQQDVLNKSVVKQQDEWQNVLMEQKTKLQQVLLDTPSEIKQLLVQMNQVPDIKKTMSNIENALNNQNRKFDKLIGEICNVMQMSPNYNVGNLESAKKEFPKWFKWMIIPACSFIIVIGIARLLNYLPIIIDYVRSLYQFLIM